MTTSAVGRPNPFWEFLPWPGFDFELDLNLEFLAFKDRRRLNGKWHGVRVGQVGQRINISLCSGIASGPIRISRCPGRQESHNARISTILFEPILQFPRNRSLHLEAENIGEMVLPLKPKQKKGPAENRLMVL